MAPFGRQNKKGGLSGCVSITAVVRTINEGIRGHMYILVFRSVFEYCFEKWTLFHPDECARAISAQSVLESPFVAETLSVLCRLLISYPAPAVKSCARILAIVAGQGCDAGGGGDEE